MDEKWNENNMNNVNFDLSPLVSVIIPVYNGEAYLETCIQSVVSQTYSHLEIIIVNDGSTDCSYEIMKCYENIDARIILVNKSNEGPQLARESGIRIAHGKYIQFLDSDDELLSDAIERLLDKAESTNADIVVAPFFFCPLGDDKMMSISPDFEELSGVEYLKRIFSGKTYWSVWSHFHKRSLYLDYAIVSVPGVAFGEDAIMMVQLVLYAQKISSISVAILNYNVHPSSISHPNTFDDKKYKEFNIYTSWIEGFIKEAGLVEGMMKEIALFHIRNIFTCIGWNRLEGISEKMKKVNLDLKQFPELKEEISRRERKIIFVFGVSSLLGNLYLAYYKKRKMI